MYSEPLSEWKPFNLKGNGRQYLFKHRYQKGLVDLFNRADHLKLSDLIYCIDMVQPFDLILIPLMNSINPDKTWLTIRLWFPSSSNSAFNWASDVFITDGRFGMSLTGASCRGVKPRYQPIAHNGSHHADKPAHRSSL